MKEVIPSANSAVVGPTNNKRREECEGANERRETQTQKRKIGKAKRGVAGHGVARTRRHGVVHETPRHGTVRDPADGLRGFERNHGNVASPGRLPSDWLFLAFPPIPWIYTRTSFATPRATPPAPIIIHGDGRDPPCVRDGRCAPICEH